MFSVVQFSLFTSGISGIGFSHPEMMVVNDAVIMSALIFFILITMFFYESF